MMIPLNFYLILIIMRRLTIIFTAVTLLNLSGCVVVAVGALSAAGASGMKKEESNSLPVEVKLNQKDEKLAADSSKEVVSLENLAQSFSMNTSEVEAHPENLIDIPMPIKEETQVSGEQVSGDAEPLKLGVLNINNTSLNNLTGHAWKVVAIKDSKDFTFKSDDSVFVFSENQKMKGFFGCNTINGKFKANPDGKFVMRSLKSTNYACNDSRELESKFEALLILADQFFINDQTLYLGFKGRSILAFVKTSKSTNLLDLKKSNRKKITDSVHVDQKKYRGSIRTKKHSLGTEETKAKNQ